MKKLLMILMLCGVVRGDIYHVFWFGGQSNMADGYHGTGPFVARADDSIYTSAYAVYPTRCQISLATTTGTMVIPTLNKIREYYPTGKLLGINSAVGSTVLITDGYYQAWDRRETDSLFYKAKTLINVTIDSLRSLGDTVTFEGAFWCQGESEGCENLFTKAQYLAELQKLAADLRTACNAPNMHFFTFQTGRRATPLGTDSSWARIRQAQIDFDGTAGNLNHFCGVTINLSLTDIVHYDSLGIKRCGLMAGYTFNQALRALPYRGPHITKWELTGLKTIRAVCSQNVIGNYLTGFKDCYGANPTNITISEDTINLTFAKTIYSIGYLSEINPTITNVITSTDSNALLLEPTEIIQLRTLPPWQKDNLEFACLPTVLKNGTNPVNYANGSFPLYSLDNSYTGTLAGNGTGKGYVSGSIKISDTSGYLATNKIIPNLVTNTDSFTITAWIKWASPPATDQYIFCQSRNSGADYYFVGLRIDANRRIVLTLRNGATGTVKNSASNTLSFTVGQLYFIEAVKAGPTLKLRINSVEPTYYQSGTWTGGTIDMTSGSIAIGNFPILHGYPCTHEIKSLSIYKCERTQEQSEVDFAIGPSLYNRIGYDNGDGTMSLNALSGKPIFTTSTADTLKLSVTLVDTTDCTYQWQKKLSGTWANVEGATASAYTVVADSALYASKPSYRCAATNSAGSSYSKIWYVNKNMAQGKIQNNLSTGFLPSYR